MRPRFLFLLDAILTISCLARLDGEEPSQGLRPSEQNPVIIDYMDIQEADVRYEQPEPWEKESSHARPSRLHLNRDVSTLQLDDQPHGGRRELLSLCYYTSYYTANATNYSTVSYQSSYQYSGQASGSYSCGKGETCYYYYVYYATGYETLSYQAPRPSPATQTRIDASESPAREHTHARTR